MPYSMSWYSVDGPPVRAGDLTITPRSRVLRAQLGRAGFAWHTPTSVLIERGGVTQRQRIVDVTRIAQVLLLLGAVQLIGRFR
jgi:hypothetical protein